MSETDIGNTVTGNLKNTITDYSVDAVNTDGAYSQKETYYDNVNWSSYLGYYKKIPELAAAIDAKATWTVGKGFKSNPVTELLLSNIKGWGKDSFNTIMENMVRTYNIGGDSFAEIIRNKSGKLVNLKPLDPGSIRIVANRAGIIIRYEQLSKNKDPNKKFQTDEIFHLARNRVADEIHGVSLIPAVEEIILMRNEAMSDYKNYFTGTCTL